jgi:hypothetical protein
MTRHVARVTLSMAIDHIVRLDRLAIDTRARSGNVLTRGEILRAILDAVFSYNLEISTAYDEPTMTTEILSHLEYK